MWHWTEFVVAGQQDKDVDTEYGHVCSSDLKLILMVKREDGI